MLKLKKVTTIFTVITMLLMCFCTNSYAISTNNTNASEQLEKIYDVYEATGENIKVTKRGAKSLSYDVEFSMGGGKTVSHIDTKIDKKGSQRVFVTEGNKHDEIVINKNGDVYENGNKLIVYEENYQEKPKVEDLKNREIAPRGGHRIYSQKSAPYGRSSDYTKLSGTIYKKTSYCRRH